MKQAELIDGPWMAFPCRCTHGCGPFYSMPQIMLTPCQGGHHDFTFPRDSVVGYTPAG